LVIELVFALDQSILFFGFFAALFGVDQVREVPICVAGKGVFFFFLLGPSRKSLLFRR
jgi:hypothetical protein